MLSSSSSKAMEHLNTLLAWCIPPAGARPHHTIPSVFIALVLPVPLLWLIAHLFLTYPKQRAPRLALLPLAAALSLRSGYFARFDPEWGQHFNQALGCYAAWNGGRALWWSFQTKQYSLRKGFESRWPSSLLLILTMRFVGWNFAPLPLSNTTSRSAFLKARGKDLVVGYLMMDFVDTFVKDPRFNPAILQDGGLVDSQRGLFGRAAGPMLTLMTGTLVYTPILAYCGLFSFLSVLLFPSTQKLWSPPVFASPLAADSIRSLWSQRWHQLFRPPFIALGYTPISRIARKLRLPRALHDALATLGVFAVSAVIHEAGTEGMRRKAGEGFASHGAAAAQFFMLQGVGCILEELWLLGTGRRVAGWIGRVWTYVFVLGSGMRITDAWFRHGIAKGFTSFHLTRPLIDVVATLLHRIY